MSAGPQRGAVGFSRRTSRVAITGAVLAVASMLLPAVGALVVSAGAIVCGVIGRRQLRKDPSTGPRWVSLIAIALGVFVFLGQAAILWSATLAG
ncbi:hypothetical protein [Agromyces sp. Marseille-Q5079]|uniref:hypothetical protein n=1 Tax=Agromyces sp. Marseille-Q5079 TaxID=3439059 RepID=UPI003D9C925A